MRDVQALFVNVVEALVASDKGSRVRHVCHLSSQVSREIYVVVGCMYDKRVKSYALWRRWFAYEKIDTGVLT